LSCLAPLTVESCNFFEKWFNHKEYRIYSEICPGYLIPYNNNTSIACHLDDSFVSTRESHKAALAPKREHIWMKNYVSQISIIVRPLIYTFEAHCNLVFPWPVITFIFLHSSECPFAW
jgi:hypothetical protein